MEAQTKQQKQSETQEQSLELPGSVWEKVKGFLWDFMNNLKDARKYHIMRAYHFIRIRTRVLNQALYTISELRYVWRTRRLTNHPHMCPQCKMIGNVSFEVGCYCVAYTYSSRKLNNYANLYGGSKMVSIWALIKARKDKRLVLKDIKKQ